MSVPEMHKQETLLGWGVARSAAERDRGAARAQQYADDPGHYAHLGPSYIGDTIRAALWCFG